jgi:hypothetical protein
MLSMTEEYIPTPCDYTFAYTPVYCVLQLDPNFELSPPS